MFARLTNAVQLQVLHFLHVNEFVRILSLDREHARETSLDSSLYECHQTIRHLKFRCFVQHGIERVYSLSEFHPSRIIGRELRWLTRLSFDDSFNETLSANHFLSGCSLTHLTFGKGFNNGGKPIKAGDIPFGVTHLQFGDNFNQTLVAGVIPLSVTHLCLLCFKDCYYYDRRLTDVMFPPRLTHLTLFSCSENEIKNIPSSVTHLEILYWFLPGRFPIGITHLILGSDSYHLVCGFDCYQED